MSKKMSQQISAKRAKSLKGKRVVWNGVCIADGEHNPLEGIEGMVVADFGRASMSGHDVMVECDARKCAAAYAKRNRDSKKFGKIAGWLAYFAENEMLAPGNSKLVHLEACADEELQLA